MTAITNVVILYNPNSTNDSQRHAEQLAKKLNSASVKVKVQATEHAGHAVEIGEQFAKEHPRGMIISSSGDGGYHELINGVLKDGQSSVVTGVLPSGNANDHYHFLHKGNTVDRIAQGDVDEVDVLKVTTSEWTHYAHSYVGIGMTSQIGAELTKAKLNAFNEVWLVVKNLLSLKHVTIEKDGRRGRFAHVVWSNSGRMSKYLTLSTEARADDGLFEVTKVKSTSIWSLFAHILQASSAQIDDTPQVKQYAFKPLHDMTIQLDGEVYQLRKNDTVTITCLHKALKCIV